MHDLSDESLCDRWVENPYFQYFCGEEFFQHKPPFDRSSLTRWRQRMGEERLVALVQESLSVATRTGAARPSDFAKPTVDTTVPPTDRSEERRVGKECGVDHGGRRIIKKKNRSIYDHRRHVAQQST